MEMINLSKNPSTGGGACERLEESGRKVPYNSDKSHDKNKRIDRGTVSREFR